MNLELACTTNQNANEDEMINIGPSNTNTACRYPPEPVNCATDAGNRLKRLGFDSKSDSFHVYVSDHRVCARRTDNGGGWGLDLSIECTPSGANYGWIPSTLNIGSSLHNTKCILADYDYTCDSHSGDAQYRVNPTQAGDRFHIYNHNDWLCTRRTDWRGGWGMDLAVACKRFDKLFNSAEVHIGGSPHNRKCVLPLYDMSCDGYAGNSGFRTNDHGAGDSFEIFRHGKWVCARRTDSGGGWGMDLKLKCRKGVPTEIKEIDIGSSSANSKCVWVGATNTCESFAGDSQYRLSAQQNGDSFYVWSSGYYACARRTDSSGGWGLNLRIRCTV